VKRGVAVLACRSPEAAGLAAPLESAGFTVARLSPERADPGRLAPLMPRILVLEVLKPEDARKVQPFWEQRPLDEHLPVLVLHPAGPPPIQPGLLDEPLDAVASPLDPREVVARAEGLLLASRIRVYRRAFHDLSQPLMIARAVAQKAIRLAAPSDALHAPLAELDRQVERMFRIVEDLQRKRAER
jgi:signal transduction histidine kinase